MKRDINGDYQKVFQNLTEGKGVHVHFPVKKVQSSSYVVGWIQPNPDLHKQMVTDKNEFRIKNMMPILVPNGNIQAYHQTIKIEENKRAAHEDLIKQSDDLANIGLLLEDKLKCKKNSDCLSISKEMYCDNHYGFCKESSKEGELCRHDNHCASNLICMFGKCNKPKISGQVGARCLDDSDCHSDYCCARLLGTKICKPKIKLNQKCFLPLGGLDYSLNESCPCVDGLFCQAIENNSDLFPSNKIRPKNPKIEHLRCSA